MTHKKEQKKNMRKKVKIKDQKKIIGGGYLH